LWLDFPTTFVIFPSRLSHLAVPAVDLSHSLAFFSLRRVKSATCWVYTLPLIDSGPIRAPWLPTTYARLPQSSRCSVAEAASGRPGPAGFSTDFTAFHPVCFSLAGVLTVAVGHTTLFSFTCAGVARPHSRYVCYPCPSKRNSAPQPLVGFPSRLLSIAPCGTGDKSFA